MAGANYEIGNKLAEGTLTDVFITKDGKHLLKIAKMPGDETLLSKEFKVLAELRATNLAELFPEILARKDISIDDKSMCDTCPERFVCFTTNRQTCMLKKPSLVYAYDKDMPSLEKVMKAYPNGIDERDMVWMFKRLLAAIWTAHSIGVVHSAVLPEHVLLNLKTHGILLIDWMHARKTDKKIKTLTKVGDDSYYPSVIENPVSLDIYMAGMCMIKLVGGVDNVSKNIRLILRACTMGATDARYVHEQLDKTVDRLYGSVFRPFKVK